VPEATQFWRTDRYDNIFIQNLSMRWARITEIHSLADTAILQAELDKLAAAGISERAYSHHQLKSPSGEVSPFA
jgi:hypothetical protein